jgi:hypothetical protein
MRDFNSATHSYIECLDECVTEQPELNILNEIKKEFKNKSTNDECNSHVKAKFMFNDAHHIVKNRINELLNGLKN